jgi:hypothetical protein
MDLVRDYIYVAVNEFVERAREVVDYLEMESCVKE